MSKLPSAVLVAVLSMPALVAAEDAANKKVDIVTGSLASLRTAAKCDDKASPWRPWCIAADFQTGSAGELPKGKVLVGMTIELEQGKDTAKALSDRVTFAAFAVDPDGKVKLTDVKPTNDGEKQAVVEAVFNTSAVFKGKAKVAKLSKDLADHFKTKKGAYATTKAGNSWTWSGASQGQLRKVGNFWVAIEIPKAGNGIFATILTDAWTGP